MIALLCDLWVMLRYRRRLWLFPVAAIVAMVSLMRRD